MKPNWYGRLNWNDTWLTILFQTALDVIGVDTAKQQIIFKVLSAILTLGNIEFKETKNVACPTKQNCKNFIFISWNQSFA